uniref:Uncharacterized protein n=1 Tax=Cannabis sativa TaxID=3483 RepID=A0A803NTX4_CANSA
MRYSVDGLAWKEFDAKHPEFSRDPRNAQLRLGADEFNPFGNMSLPYNMWPVDINDNEDETDVNVVHDSNSLNFMLTVDLKELILQSDELAVIVEPNNQAVDVEEKKTMKLDEDYVDKEIDDLLVELVEDENKNLVNGGNDSDSSL